MGGKNGPNTLSVNVFTAPGKAMVGERPKPFGEPLGFDPITSTLIFGEHDVVLVAQWGQWRVHHGADTQVRRDTLLHPRS